jgi:putative transposase
LYEAAKGHNFEILDCEVDINHVHVIASLPLTMTPTYAIQLLKGITAKGLFVELPELERLYKKGHLWSPGKFVGSIGYITLDKAKSYLETYHAKYPVRESLPRSVAKGLPEGQAFRFGRMSSTSTVRRSI